MKDPNEENFNLSIEAKREVIHFFEDLLAYFWSHLCSVIGETTTLIVFQSALRETVAHHTFLEDTQVSETGIELSLQGEGLLDVEWSQLRAGLLALLESCLGLLRYLTGNILVGKLEPMVAEFISKVERV